MGSLSNLYISQSYQGLIHLATNTSASANLIELQDGLGNNLGVSLNTQGDISASGDLTINTLRIELDTEITGAVDINTFFTASTPGYTNSTNPYFTDVVRVIGSYPANNDYPTINDVRVGWICNGINVTNGIVTAVSGSGTGDVYVTIAGSLPQISQPYTFRGMISRPVRITGSLEVSNDITAGGTINSNRVITTTISSSQIYSSGSNQFGDSISDTQTIVGQTSISGSLTNRGDVSIYGNTEFIGNIRLNGNFDFTGSLKVTNDISSSTLNGIGNVTAYSASVDSRLDYLEGPFSTSVDNRLDLIEFFTSSQETKDLTLAAYTGSNNTKWNTLTNVTASVLAFTSSQETKDITLGAYTASLINAFTASGKDVTFNGNISVSGSINAYAIYTTIESSSVIYSSGSNVLGDASNDTQTLNGTVNVVNTLFVSGTEFTPFSASVDSRLDQLETDSGSQAQKINSLELFTASQNTKNSTLASYTASQDTKNSTLGTYTASIDSKFTTLGNYTSSIDTKFSTLGTYTASIDTKFTAVGYSTASLNAFTASASGRLNNLELFTSSLVQNFVSQTQLGIVTSSLATTGSNTFVGNEIFSGSVRGVVVNTSISSNTASIDCSLGNFFNLTLQSSTNTYLTATNIQPGQTLQIKINQPSTIGTLTYSSNFKFITGSTYTVSSISNASDILSSTAFDTNYLYTVATKAF